MWQNLKTHTMGSALLVLLLAQARASIRFSKTLSSHAVLQRAPSPALLWGWTEPGATVTGSLRRDGERVDVTINPDGSVDERTTAARQGGRSTYSKVTRFCIICNYASKIIPALQSRLSMVSAISNGVLNSPSKRPSTTRAGISTCSMNMSESSKLAMVINCRWLSASPSLR